MGCVNFCTPFDKILGFTAIEDCGLKSQNTAPTAGVLQGGTPQKPSEIDDVWAGVMGASRNSKI